MNTTIVEGEAEELTAKLHDERKLSSDQNGRIAELEERLVAEYKFRDEWEHWVGRYQMFNSNDDTLVIFEAMRLKYNELKAQHLGDDSKTS